MGKQKVMQLVPAERIANSILIVRGNRVLLDVDLAAMYGVENRALLQAVKRNPERFPDDFMLQLTLQEWANLRSQIVISSSEHGGRRYAPYAFTEQGIAMLSSVLKSSRAIAVNVEIMRAFEVDMHDQAIAGILKAIRELMNPPAPKRRGIGFTADLDEK